jgi:hypothetical protein
MKKMLSGLLLVYAIPKQALKVTVAKAEASSLWPFQAPLDFVLLTARLSNPGLRF